MTGDRDLEWHGKKVFTLAKTLDMNTLFIVKLTQQVLWTSMGGDK